jgi:ferredoxin
MFRVRFEDGTEFACDPGCAVSIAMKHAGLRATLIGCRGGGCGVCRVRVLQGDYRTGKMSREHVSLEDEQQGFALGCCLYPISDLVLRASPQ